MMVNIWKELLKCSNKMKNFEYNPDIFEINLRILESKRNGIISEFLTFLMKMSFPILKKR